MTIGILIVPVFISLFYWVFANKGIMWIVRTLDWMLSTEKLKHKSTWRQKESC